MTMISTNGIHHSIRNHANFRLRSGELWYQIHIPVQVGKPLEKYANRCLSYVHVDAVIANNPAWKAQLELQ